MVRQFSTIRCSILGTSFFLGLMFFLVTEISANDRQSQFLEFTKSHEQRFLASVTSGRQEILIKKQGYTARYDIRVRDLDYVIEVYELIDASGHRIELTESQCVEWQVSKKIPADGRFILAGIRAGNSKYEFVLDNLAGEERRFEIKSISLTDHRPLATFGVSPVHLPISAGVMPLGEEVAGGHMELLDWQFDSTRNLWIAKVRNNDEYIQLIEIDPTTGLFLKKEVVEHDSVEPTATHQYEYVDGHISRWVLYRAGTSTPKEQRYYRRFEPTTIDPSAMLISHYGFEEPLGRSGTNLISWNLCVALLIAVGLTLLFLARRTATATPSR
jgi:hypothetical protein